MIKKHHNIVPIPTSRKVERITENFGSLKVQLTNKEINNIDELVKLSIYRAPESDKIKILIVGRNI